MPACKDSLDWLEEAELIELDQCDFDVALAAELPTELHHHGTAAEHDPDFDQCLDEWLGSFSEDLRRMLAMEQCCDEGALLPWDMRSVRLRDAPGEVLGFLHLFWDNAPRHVAVHLAHFVYWLIRAERGRRTGSAFWRRSSL